MKAILDGVKPRAAELFAAFKTGTNLYRQAYERGQSLTAYLSDEMPYEDYKDGMDGFERMLYLADFKMRSIPERGIYADKLETMGESVEGRALLPEWVARVARRAKGPVQTRAVGGYGSDDSALQAWGRPYYDDPQQRLTTQISPAVPLSEIVALTTQIEGDAYRAFYLTDVAAQERLVRIAQGAEFPRAILAGGERTVRLYKYGRALEVTYEQLRRQPIDWVAWHISRIAIQAETDKVATAIDILINGDGNSGTAATSFNLGTLDTASTPPALTLLGWLAFKLKFLNPYSLTTVLTRDSVSLKLMLLNVGSANLPLVSIQAASGFGSFRPINPQLADGVAIGTTADAPSNQILGFDRRFALHRLHEIGSDISETDRWITRQVNVLTLSETEGYAVLDGNAAKLLNLAA